MAGRIEVGIILNVEEIRTFSDVSAKRREQVIVQNAMLVSELFHAALRKIYVIVVAPFVEGVHLLSERYGNDHEPDA
jgi:hypothetical protein